MPWEKQFDVDEALTGAMQVFWAQGYSATSTQDLLDRMGINRGSLYDTFGSKRELFLSALDHYEKTYQRQKIAQAGAGRAPRETIHALFSGLAAEALTGEGRSGCLLVNTALELAPHDAEIAEIVRAAMHGIEEFFFTTVEQGQSSGDIPDHVNAADAARALLALLIGLRVLARSLPDKAVLDSIVVQASALIE